MRRFDISHAGVLVSLSFLICSLFSTFFGYSRRTWTLGLGNVTTESDNKWQTYVLIISAASIILVIAGMWWDRWQTSLRLIATIAMSVALVIVLRDWIRLHDELQMTKEQSSRFDYVLTITIGQPIAIASTGLSVVSLLISALAQFNNTRAERNWDKSQRLTSVPSDSIADAYGARSRVR